MESILKEIKSIIILKKIFSQIYTTKKLIFIHHNKSLQKKLGIISEDFKKESGKIRVIEENGYGYEFKLNLGIIIFEGYYLNGEKSGKGKEYNEDGKVQFEGEYLNGQKIEGNKYDNEGNKILRIEKDGTGREYYDNGYFQFKGKYIDGRRWNGKGYDYNGKEIFKIKNGKGKGKEYSIKS